MDSLINREVDERPDKKFGQGFNLMVLKQQPEETKTSNRFPCLLPEVGGWVREGAGGLSRVRVGVALVVCPPSW